MGNVFTRFPNGFPYLVQGLGVPAATASVLLSLLIIGQVAGGPMVGWFIGHRPELRMYLVVGYLALNALTWMVLLCWPQGRPPMAVIAVGFVIFALGGPVSSVAFALARDYNSLGRVGTATGVANSGGHPATAVGVLLVGLMLQILGPLPGGAQYRMAMLALVALLIFGTARTLVWWRRARAAVLPGSRPRRARPGGPAPPPLGPRRGAGRLTPEDTEPR